MPHPPEPPNDLAVTRALYTALTGEPTLTLETAAEVIAALKAGQDAIVVELPWGELRQGEIHARHQITLVGLQGDRVRFINPLKGRTPPGKDVGGTGKGPRRRIEIDGHESMPLAQFEALFAQGGRAMRPV